MNIKELTNEELAVILRCMRVTGLAKSEVEKAALDEAADRLELMEVIINAKRN